MHDLIDLSKECLFEKIGNKNTDLYNKRKQVLEELYNQVNNKVDISKPLILDKKQSFTVTLLSYDPWSRKVLPQIEIIRV